MKNWNAIIRIRLSLQFDVIGIMNRKFQCYGDLVLSTNEMATGYVPVHIDECTMIMDIQIVFVIQSNKPVSSNQFAWFIANDRFRIIEGAVGSLVKLIIT